MSAHNKKAMFAKSVSYYNLVFIELFVALKTVSKSWPTPSKSLYLLLNMFLVMWNMGVINEIFLLHYQINCLIVLRPTFRQQTSKSFIFFCILLIMTYELKSLVRFHTELPFSDSTILVSYTSYYVFENS